MPMSKKEQERVEQLEADLALRHTGPVAVDIDPEVEDLKGETYGFYRGVVTVQAVFPKAAVTTNSGHGVAAPGGRPRMSSQRGVALFSNRANALRQLRYQLEQQTARELRRIDLEILKEEQEPSNPRGDS